LEDRVTDNNVPDQSEIIHLEVLATMLQRRLRVLEIHAAGFGPLAIPAHLVLERENAQRQLVQIRADLFRLRPASTGSRMPYRGLFTFQEADAGVFFGRDRLVADLVAQFRAASFLAVFGASGSGKSSVVRAGLIPQLKAGVLPSSQHWRYVTLKPGARPRDALAEELAKLHGDPTASLRFSEALGASDQALLLIAGALLDRASGQRLVLVIDQAEELWTQAPADPTARERWRSQQQQPFIQLLVTAAIPADTPVVIVLTMRADFFHRAAENTALASAINAHDVIVINPMTRDELHDAITRPAEQAGGSFEPGLVDELINQVVDRPGTLPLLEYILERLWAESDISGLMTWATYRGLGGVEGALGSRADALLHERYSLAQQDELRHILLRLVQPGEGTTDTRRRVSLADLALDGAPLEAVEALLQPLVDERLLVISSDTSPQDSSTSNDEDATTDDTKSGSVVVEVAHEALIRAWPKLGLWIADARADLRFQHQVGEAARDWMMHHEDASLLWSGLRLQNANAWQERAQPSLNADELHFLETDRAVETARQAAEEAARREREALLKTRAQSAQRLRRRAQYLAGALLAALVAMIAAVYGFVQANERAAEAQQSALQAQIQGLVSAAQSAFYRGEVDQAGALALAAIAKKSDSNLPEGVVAPIYAIADHGTRRYITGHSSAVLSVAFSPDGITARQAPTITHCGCGR
jgi:hypothetical protein